MDEDTEQFQNDLLESVRQMRSNQVARRTSVPVSPVVEARQAVGVSQSKFARMLGVSTRTLQEWEQGRRKPSAAAATLIEIAKQHPRVVIRALRNRPDLAQAADVHTVRALRVAKPTAATHRRASGD